MSGSDDEHKVLPARSAASTGATSTESIEEKMPAATLSATTGSSIRTQQDEDDMIADAYTKTQELLVQPSSFLAPFPSVVSLRDLVQEPLTCSGTLSNAAGTGARAIGASYAIGAPQAPLQQRPPPSSMSLLEDSPTSLLSPNKGHHTLFRALEELEGLEKEEANLLEQSPLTAPLTQVVVQGTSTSTDTAATVSTPNTFPMAARHALQTLNNLANAIPRRVCQHPFRRNDIVWVCRTCQADETCVLCHACFSQSSHEGHDVAFYHAQAGGCCDCGDPDAWDPAGFCPHHGPPPRKKNKNNSNTDNNDDVSPLTPLQVKRVRGVVPAVVDWMVQRIAQNAQAGYQRAMVVRRSVIKNANSSKVDRMDLVNNLDSIDSHSFGDDVNAVAEHADIEMGNTDALNGDSTSFSHRIEHHDPTMEDDDSHSYYNDRNDSSNNNNENPNDSVIEIHNPQDYRSDVWDYNEDLEASIDAGAHANAFDGVFSAAAASSSPSSTTNATTSTNTNRPLHVQLSPFLHNPFSPSLASRSNSNSNNTSHITNSVGNTSPTVLNFAQKVGNIGRQGRGLYLVLFADDIHSPSQWIDALREFLGASSYYTDSLLAKFVRALRQYGQLVCWGTMELVAECGATNANLWLDGDPISTKQMANALLKRAKKLLASGFFCSIVTREELQLEQRAVAVLQWMSALARSCDPLCQTVAECILPNRHLVPLLRVDFKLSARITKAWYSLLLTLLAVPSFKSHLAAAYCDTYRSVTAKYAAGMGLLERSAYTLSVQFLNRVTYVVDLVQGRDLLGKLGKSLLETLKVAQSARLEGRLNPNHFVLSHRRYSPCISDLKCVLNVKGMKRLFACQEGTFLQDWVSSLSLAQLMDTQVWRHWTQGHIEDEARGWVGAFNLSISLGSLFERLLSWEDGEPSPIKDPASPLSRNLLSCTQLTYHILISGIAEWQLKATQSCVPSLFTSAIDPHRRCPASLPFSTIAANHGCAMAMEALPIAQVTPFSFHLPLHRFLAACLREVCLRRTNGVDGLFEMISSKLPLQELDQLLLGLMEYPVLVLTRASQVRAGLWRRNGPGLNDQVLNYAEPPFCRSMRDADLLLIQFSVLKRTTHQSSATERPDSDVGMAFLVHLLLHRLGVFDFVGLTKAPNSNMNRYLDEISKQLYPRELRPEGSVDDDFLLPWTYSPARDGATRLVLLEEFLHLMLVFMVELPPLPPKDKEEHTHQAKDRLRREVIHRLASGPKTHSELSEVHLVLSHWDNVFLSEEGKLVNPDDATGAALGAVLEEVSVRKSSRGKMEPDKWELRRSAWESYDPSFFHISLRSHQTAAEGRPQLSSKNSIKAKVFGEAKAYGPAAPRAHPAFERLRRDATADATILAVCFRILHLHCRENRHKDVSGLRRGKIVYENDERSETALARAVHILTLGAFAWDRARADDPNWRIHGGGSVGSVFFNRPDDAGSPSVSNWIEAALLLDPGELLEGECLEGEENAFVLLRRLAVDGGIHGSFVAGDKSVRSGAAWLCEFTLKHCPAAAAHLSTNAVAEAKDGSNDGEESETDLQKKKRLAKEKALARMKDQAAKFASIMKAELDDGGEDDKGSGNKAFSSTVRVAPMQILEAGAGGTGQRHHHPTRSSSLGSSHSFSSNTSAETYGAESDRSTLSQSLVNATHDNSYTTGGEYPSIPNRLLKVRPQCIICNDESNSDARVRRPCEEDQHKRGRRRKMDGGNALGFVAYCQASTVMKGGGGPPCSDDSPMSPVRRFVGAHVALCGHAVHSECCEAYLAIASHKEDRVIGKRDEFRCPLCQRLSNCLVPFIDVGEDWICSPTLPSDGQLEQTIAKTKSDTDVDMLLSDKGSGRSASFVSLHRFLSVTPWWVTRHNPHVDWDGRSAYVSKSLPPSTEPTGDRSSQSDSMVTTPTKPRRRSVRSLRKKDLYAAWNAMMRTPRFVRRKFRNRHSEEGTHTSRGEEALPGYPPDQDETTGETVVWRRFMDQVCDVAYRADSKRLGEDNLHYFFGEFRHYIVEKFSYNLVKRSAGSEPADVSIPFCCLSPLLRFQWLGCI